MLFCNQLTSILREVKYLDMLKTPNIPKAAVQLHSQQERLYMVSFWACNIVLDIVTVDYQSMWTGNEMWVFLLFFFFVQYTQTLTLVTQWYNQLHSTLLDVELGLVKDEMDMMRRQLEPALQELVWSQDDLMDYIQSTQDLMKASLPHKNRWRRTVITAVNKYFHFCAH